MIKRINPILIVCLLPCLLAFAGPDWADFTGKVVAVKDGDTLEVMNSGAAVTVRLDGIDCPEKAQAFGQRAKQFASDQAFGKQVKVIEKEKDRYGRPVAEIILPDGRSLNRELVRAGMAWWYRQYAPNDAVLEALEKEARGYRLGLWTDLDTAAPPIPPWEWRKEGEKTVTTIAPQVTGQTITPQADGGYIVKIEGRFYAAVRPTGGGGYVVTIEGQSSTTVEPTVGGGYVVRIERPDWCYRYVAQTLPTVTDVLQVQEQINKEKNDARRR